MIMMKKLLWGVALMAASLTSVAQAQAQNAFPARPIKIVVATPAGGPADISARVLAEALHRDLGQPVVVENKVGASGVIGADFVAKSPADGYTLFFGTGSTNVVAPAMLKNVPYDPSKDFTPLSLVGEAVSMFYVRSSLGATTLAEVVALARAKPGTLSFATTGPGAVYELAALSLELAANVKFNHVPYKGFAPIIQDLAGEHVDVGVGSPEASAMQNPRIRVVASLGSGKLEGRPDIRSAAEQGYPAFDIPVWGAIFAPAGIPGPVAEKLTAALMAAMARPEVQAKIRASGLSKVIGSDAATLQRKVAKDLETVQNLMKRAGVERQ